MIFQITTITTAADTAIRNSFNMKDFVRLTNAASQAGNWLDIVCDGNAYYVNGAAGQNAAFTFA